MIHLMLLMLNSVGLALLCLARERHQRDLIGRRLSAGTAMRVRRCGWLGLLLAYPIATNSLGWARGTLEWMALLSVAAVLVTIVLAICSARNSVSR